MSYEPKVVVITGASAGLGRAIAHGYAKRGCKLALLARNPQALQAAVSECAWLGGEAIAVPTDVSDAKAVEHAAAEATRKLGAIDVWINNAMVSVFSPIKEMTASDFKRVTDVTYLGYVHGTLAAIKRMLPRDRGTIIQIGSALAYRSIPLQSAYCASKHAINGFTDSLRCELIHDKSNVKLTTVQMPAMNTTQFSWVKSRLRNQAQPVGPIFEPEVAAKIVVAAGYAKRPRREYWVGMPTVKAVVGQKVVPGFADWYLGTTGYDSQQIPDQPRDPASPNNLYEYVHGTHSARGPFDAKSKHSSLAVEASLHRNWLLLSAGAVLMGAAAIWKGRRS